MSVMNKVLTVYLCFLVSAAAFASDRHGAGVPLSEGDADRCGNQTPSVEDLRDLENLRHGLDLNAVSKRQIACRKLGVGEDISTTIELFMGSKVKLKDMSLLAQEQIKIVDGFNALSKSKKKKKKNIAEKEAAVLELQDITERMKMIKSVAMIQAAKIQKELNLSVEQVANISMSPPPSP